MSVPKDATYFKDWDEWGVGQMVDEKMEGDWKLWRGDGTFVEESPWKAGKTHGQKRRYHDDGSLASNATYVDGTMTRVLLWRTKKKTREPNFERMPKNIHELEFLYADDGWQTCQRFRTKDGKEIDLHGKPVPPRPASVPELGYYNSEDKQWLAGEWHLVGGETERRRLYRYWSTDGTLRRLEYYLGEETAILDRRPEMGAESNPLIEAATAKDDAAVELCLKAGLGHSANAAMHAAYEGLPELSLRIAQAPRSDAAVPDPRNIPPERRDGIPPEAVWVAGMERWMVGRFDERTGRAEGTWKIWWAPGGYTFVMHEQTDFKDGRRTAFRKHRKDIVEEETLYDPTGKPTRTREWEDGVMEETEERSDGTTAKRRFFEAGPLRAERIVRGEGLVHETWFAEDGTKRAEVSPASEQLPASDDDEETLELWRAFDPKGALRAEGFTRSGLDGRAVGKWTVDGSTADFGVVSIRKTEELGEIASTICMWQAHKPPPALKGIEKLPWKKMETFFGDAVNFPFYLRGLAIPNPRAVKLAIQHLWDPVLHQGTISEAAGPVFRSMAAIAQGVTETEALAEILDFMIAIATRHGDIDAANTHKRLYLEKPKAGGKHFGKNEVEPSYFDVCDAITSGVKAWTRFAAHEDERIRRGAIVLLAIAADSKAEAALVGRLRIEPKPELRGDILLGLALHRPARELLEPFLSDDAPLRLAAALTWVRTHIEPYDPAARVLIDCLIGALDPKDWGDLFLGTGDAKSDAASTLTLLPAKQAAEHLDRMCGALADTDGKNAVAIAGALLQLVFGTSEWEEGKKLSQTQRTVLDGIAASDRAWTFDVNLAEVLREHGLPDDRDSLRALLGGKKGPAKSGSRILSAFGGPSGGVTSFVKPKEKKRARR